MKTSKPGPVALPIGAPRPLLDSKQVATILGTTVRTVQCLVKYRRLANVRGLGRHLKFRSETVDQFIRDLELYSAKPAKLKKAA
jgi:excisionase family DNA binding protein